MAPWLCIPMALGTVTALAQGGKPQGLLFRGTHYFLIPARAGDAIEFTITPYIPSQYGTKRAEVQLVSADGSTLLSRRWIDAPLTAEADAPRDGFCAFRVRGFRDWYQVRVGRPYAVFHSQLQPLHITGAGERLYFTAPEGAGRVRVYVQCDSPNEGATVRVISPEGDVVLERTDQFDRVTPLDVPVRREQAGKAWAIELGNPREKGETYGLDDTVIYFSQDVPPVVSPDREALEQITRQLGRSEATRGEQP